VRAGLEARLLQMEQFFRTLPCHDIQVSIGPGNPVRKAVTVIFEEGKRKKQIARLQHSISDGREEQWKTFP